MPNFIKILHVRGELFPADGRRERWAGRETDGRTDRQKDMTKLITAFRNFVNAPKNF